VTGLVWVRLLFMFRTMIRFRFNIRVIVSIMLRVEALVWFRTRFRF
jgi:hypothetical protein